MSGITEYLISKGLNSNVYSLKMGSYFSESEFYFQNSLLKILLKLFIANLALFFRIKWVIYIEGCEYKTIFDCLIILVYSVILRKLNGYFSLPNIE